MRDRTVDCFYINPEVFMDEDMTQTDPLFPLNLGHALSNILRHISSGFANKLKVVNKPDLPFIELQQLFEFDRHKPVYLLDCVEDIP